MLAVVLFTYNRPKLLKRALKTHKKLEGVDYIAFIDKSDKQIEIYNIIKDSGIYDEIILRDERYGCNENIKQGINTVFYRKQIKGNYSFIYDSIIVLEDDLLLMNNALEFLQGQLDWLKS